MRTGGKNILGAARLGQRFDPLILRAEAAVDVSSNASPNNNALINPTGEPWEIHEIKFGVRRESNLAVARAIGASLDVSLSWCGKPITDGFVPVWNCSPQQAVEEHRGLMGNPDPNIMGLMFNAQDCFYTWKLDHPLFIPPRKSVAVEFRNNGIANFALRSSISLVGRVMPRSAAPREVRVPYVSVWKSAFYDFLPAGAAEVSPETVLFNQFRKPLMVERFIGRIVSRIQAIPTAGVHSVFVDQMGDFGWRGSAFSAKHRMTDGSIVAREWARFGDLYGWRNYRSTARHLLEPDVGHVVELRKNAAPANSSITAEGEVIAASAQAAVSMVGWREEEVP